VPRAVNFEERWPTSLPTANESAIFLKLRQLSGQSKAIGGVHISFLAVRAMKKQSSKDWQKGLTVHGSGKTQAQSLWGPGAAVPSLEPARHMDMMLNLPAGLDALIVLVASSPSAARIMAPVTLTTLTLAVL
jgi:hypothetical protein